MRVPDLSLSEHGIELAELKYREQSHDIIEAHEDKLRPLRGSYRTGALQEIDDIFVSMARELAEAWVEAYLEEFRNENIVPNVEDINNMEHRINYIVESVSENEFFEARNGVISRLGALPHLVHKRLRDRVRMMELGNLRPKASDNTQSTSHQIHIHGHNYGPIQQGNQNSTQNVTINAQFNQKIDELLNLIEGAQVLSPTQKLKATTDIKYIQELSKLGDEPEVKEEAKSRLDGVMSVISMSADLVSLGTPIIQIIRAFFGI